MFGLTHRYLLDKNIIRRLIKELWRFDQANAEEQLVIALWHQIRQAGDSLYMSVETSNLLQRFSTYREIGLVSKTVAVLATGRYFKRWAHRLREQGFTREDAKLLSLGVFGAEVGGSILGVETIVTLDRPLINHYRQRRARLNDQLAAMTVSLDMPYSAARLPQVTHPAELWLEMLADDTRS